MSVPNTTSTANLVSLQVPIGTTVSNLYQYMPTTYGSLDIRTFGALSNGLQVKDASFTSSTTSTITSPSGLFKSTDVGKLCVCIDPSLQPSSTRYGSITQYISSTQVITSLNNLPTSNSNAEFIWATDDTVAINATLASAAASYPRGAIFIPQGITGFSTAIITPNGVNIYGVGNTPTAGVPTAMQWCGSTLALLGNASSPALTIGTSGTTVGALITGINVDFCNIVSQGMKNGAWEMHIDRCTIARAYFKTLSLSGSSILENSSVYCQQQGIVLSLDPSDVRAVNNYIFGAQTGSPVVLITGADVILTNNHMFRPPDAIGLTGDMVQISNGYGSGAGLNKGNILIANNAFDSCKGSGVNITLTNSSTSQAIGIVGNSFFQNDAVTNNTYNVVTLNIGAGSAVRALSVSSNVIQGSFNDITKGQWKALIDGSAVAGNVYASTVMGNAIDNCGVLYNAFVPDFSFGNPLLAGSSTVVSYAGNAGEYISSSVASGSAISLVTIVASNITSIVLTAGEWDLTGAVDFHFGATTSYTNLMGGASSISLTFGGQDTYFDFEIAANVPTSSNDPTFVCPTNRLVLTTTTTVYLVAQAAFTLSTLTAYGTIRARRVR